MSANLRRKESPAPPAGAPINTRDLDIVPRLLGDDAPRLVAALTALDARFRPILPGRDIAPTVEQFSLGDPFWAANAFQAITLEQSGCGSNVINYPGLVPLAGWAPGQVSIGYRDDGAGRVWMTEFDWSDGEINDPYTEQLMGSMIVTDG